MGGFGGAFDDFVEEVADAETEAGRDGEDSGQGDEDVVEDEVGVVGRVDQLYDFVDIEAG